MKKCKDCGEIKELDCYNQKQTRCKKCQYEYYKKYISANREACNRRSKKWRDENPEKIKNSRDQWREKNPDKRMEYSKKYVESGKHMTSRLKCHYGITNEEYAELLEKTNSKCYICKKLLSKPCVDHDHTNGQVRGILCSNCNLAIGLLYDNIEILQSAIDYLKDNGKMPINISEKEYDHSSL